MAGITVEEALRVALPPGTALLGGQRGLRRTISGTTTYRARTPAFAALHGGELALVALPVVRQTEPRPRLDRMVAQLADAGVAAIALLGTTTEDQLLFDSAAAAADEHGLPVAVVPADYSADSLDAELHRHLASQREALLRRSHEVQQELTALALDGRGLPAIVERLAALTGLPAAWEDPALELRNWAAPPAARAGLAELPGDVPALLREGRLPLLRWANATSAAASSQGAGATGNRSGTNAEVATLPLRADDRGGGSPWRRLVVTFAAGGEVAGYLSLLAANGAADQEARLALAGAGLAASIEALRVRTVAEAQGNALASLVRDWLAGRFTSTGELAERAAQLGHPPAPPYGVVVIESSQPLLEDDLQRIARTLKSQSSIGEGRARLVSRNGVGGSAVEETTERGTLSATMDDRRTALLVPLADPPALEGATAPLHQLLASLGDGQGRRAAVFAGIGRPATRVEDVPRAYRDAAGAAATARRLGGQHRVAYFGALGVYRVLAAVSPGEELASFYEDTLGPLVAHDRKSGGELLRTLEAYVSCGGSPLESAQRLHAHRNTVLYRLDRISEILGVDVREPEQRLVLHLALRAGQLLEERPARQVLSA